MNKLTLNIVTWLSFLFVSLTGMISTPVQADYQSGSQSFSFGVGGVGVISENSTKDDDVTITGSAGLQYLRYFSSQPAFALGVDINGAWNQTSSYSPSGSDNQTDGEWSNSQYMGIGKLAYPKGLFRPYITLGIGIAHSAFEMQRYTITETSQKTGAAFQWGVGMDVCPGSTFLIGLEYRQNYFTYGRHETSLGKAPRDLGTDQFFLRIGMRWGESK